MHTSILPSFVSKLQSVLGSHIVQRNVLLSSGTDSKGHSNAYTWTTAYATLMSMGQMTGTFSSNSTMYDDGEANYRLPFFNNSGYNIGYNYWLRGISGYSNKTFHVWSVDPNGAIESGWQVYGEYVSSIMMLRPLICIR